MRSKYFIFLLFSSLPLVFSQVQDSKELEKNDQQFQKDQVGLEDFLKNNPNIKYFAVSNIHSVDDLKIYLETVPKHVILVPKIESVKGITNIKEIMISNSVAHLVKIV